MHPTGNLRVLDQMVDRGVLTAEQREVVRSYQSRMGGRVEDALLEVNALDETALLKFVAGMNRTRFVSTEKLSKAEIDRATLDRIPKKLAERHGLCPVLWDAKSETISIVTADPADTTAQQEVQIAASAKKVNTFVALPTSVRAAINKHYNGDIHAFAVLDRAAQAQFSTMMDVYERNVLSEETMAHALVAGEATQERVLSGRELEKTGSSSSASKGMASDSYLETLNVLVSLLENTRPDLRGHSSHTARLVKKLAERIGVSSVEVAAYQIAGYVHDLGKMSSYHLTALNVAEYEGHRAQASKGYKAPLRLMEAIELPREARQSLESMYERYDGKGLPGSVTGKEIPLGARLLAIADTYADLTQNPKNPYRKTLRPVQACEVLARFKGTIFDPNLVDLFKHSVTGDDLKARLLANRNLALLVEPDPEETTVLELRMIEQGFEVRIARTPEQAIKFLEAGDIEVVVSELDLKPQDGFALLGEVRKHDWGKRLPWVILTSRVSSVDAKRAFELGAADFMSKPVATDLLVAKLKQIMAREERDRAPRGVGGSLTEMGLPDIIQVLWHGRKSGSLKIRSGNDQGEIHFVDGAIFNSMWGKLRGEEAFYAMLTLTDGDFSLDPSFKAPQQVIQASPEALLLEGMRRLDEAAR
ncbi:MAG TPA: HD domain-containing phosphohydrolase [Polyangiaceae bacterium]|jgi:response regulator RpfG family c-di-GMP phosphodiesterase|nr:HD domain-containing phosphohydrolase [Polyangiaceae bacterium]